MTVVVDGVTGATVSPGFFINGYADEAATSLAQAAVINFTTTTPPSVPANGDAYIVGTGATGIWATKDGQLAVWRVDITGKGSWAFYPPQQGWSVYDKSASAVKSYNGTAWIAGSIQAADLSSTTAGKGLALIGDSTSGTNAQTSMDARMKSATLAATGGAALVGADDASSGSLWTTLQGFVNYLKSSVGSSVLGFIQASAGAVANTVQGKLRQPVQTAKDRGAVGDGVTNDRAAIAACDAIGPFDLTPGSYYIGTSITIVNFVRFQPGAKLVIPTGVTVTFAGGIDAGAVQIFSISGTGTVTFTNTMPAFGLAEWWGAIPNSSGAASGNLTAINAALVALRKVQLLVGDYWVSGTVVNAVANTTLAGISPMYDGLTTYQATRLLCTSNSTAILQVGPSSYPGSINAMPQGIRVIDLYCNRSVAPLISSGCDGVTMIYCRSSELRNVVVGDAMNGFHIFGCVSSNLVECRSARAVAGTGTGTDFWNGFNIDGSFNIGAAGGNASIYLTRCSASCNLPALQTTNANGMYLNASTYGIQDTFLDHCETVSCYIGTNVNGGGTGGQADIRIVHQTDDQCNRWGILVSGVTSTGVIELTNYYAGMASGSQFGAFINNCSGTVTMLGGEVLLSGLSGVTGISISGSSGVVIDKTIVTEVNAAQGVVVAGVSNSVIQPVIHNAAHTTTGAGVQVSGTCNANYIAPLVYGQAGAFGFGIQVIGTADGRNEYNCSAIDSGCISGGSGNKLTRNGVQITTTGLSGTNLVSGVMT